MRYLASTQKLTKHTFYCNKTVQQINFEVTHFKAIVS